MIPNSECTNKHINKIQSNPSSFIDLNQQKTTPLNISVASNNSFRKKATQVFTTNTQVHKITETVSNFSQPTHRYATSSSILVNGEATTCLIDTGAFTSFISASYFNTRSLSLRLLTVDINFRCTRNNRFFCHSETVGSRSYHRRGYIKTKSFYC